MDVNSKPIRQAGPQELFAARRERVEPRLSEVEPQPGLRAEKEKDPTELRQMADRMNDAVATLNQSLKFEFSEHNRLIIKLVDTNTKEVIREIPPESLVRAFEHMQELMGLLLDRKL